MVDNRKKHADLSNTVPRLCHDDMLFDCFEHPCCLSYPLPTSQSHEGRGFSCRGTLEAVMEANVLISVQAEPLVRVMEAKTPIIARNRLINHDAAIPPSQNIARLWPYFHIRGASVFHSPFAYGTILGNAEKFNTTLLTVNVRNCEEEILTVSRYILCKSDLQQRV